MTTDYCRRENAPQVMNSFQNDIYEVKQYCHKLLEERFADFLLRA
jgi:hypothetical protein